MPLARPLCLLLFAVRWTGLALAAQIPTALSRSAAPRPQVWTPGSPTSPTTRRADPPIYRTEESICWVVPEHLISGDETRAHTPRAIQRHGAGFARAGRRMRLAVDIACRASR